MRCHMQIFDICKMNGLMMCQLFAMVLFCVVLVLDDLNIYVLLV